MTDKLLTRRQILSIFGGATGAAIVGTTQADLGSDEQGNLYGGTANMAGLFQVGPGLWKGPLSVRSDVPKEDGHDFIQTDAGDEGNLFAIHHYDGGWDEQGVSAKTVSTDKQRITQKNIYVYGANGELIDSIDPTATDTALQDANDAVGAASEGTVVIPPDTTAEQYGTVSGSKNKSYIGHGYQSQVKFTDLTSPAFDQSVNSDDLQNSYFHNLKLSGVDRNNRTAGASLFKFNGENVANWNGGIVRIDGWNDDVIHFDTSHPFGSHWDFIDGRWCRGTILHDENQGATDLSIAHFKPRTDNSLAMNLTGNINLRVGQLYCGRDNGPALNDEIGPNGALHIDQIEWESEQDITSINNGSIIKLTRGAPVYIVSVSANVDSKDVIDQVVSLQFVSERKIIGPISNAGTVNNNLINITHEPAGESWYFGPSSDIQNDAGTSTSLVRSMGAAGTGNG